MPTVYFQNGPDAPGVVTVGEFDTAADAKTAAEKAVADYGTVDDAAAWVDGNRPKEWDAKPILDL